MAEGKKLTVEIGADINPLQKGIDKAKQELQKLKEYKAANIKVGLDTTKLDQQISVVESQITKLGSSMAAGGSAMASAAQGASQVAGQLGGVSDEAAAAGQATELLSTAMAGGLTGALTAVVGALKLAYDWYIKNEEAALQYSRAINEANVEATKSAGAEIATLNALVAVAQDKTKSDEERITATKQLQDLYPATFANMTSEQIMTQNLTGYVKQLTTALINKAKAEIYANKIAEYTAKQQEISQKAIERVANPSLWTKFLAATGNGASALGNINRELSNSAEEFDTAGKQIENFTKLLEGVVTAGYEPPKAIKAKTVKAIKPANVTPQVSALNPLITAGLTEIKAGVKGYEDVISTAKFPTGVFVAPLSDELMAVELALLDFNERASGLINGALTDTFAGIGNAIGGALATGGDVMGAVGMVLLESLGGLLTALGKMAIQVGVGLLGIKLALKTLNPYAAIAAGIALVALGSMFSSKSKSLGASMGGGGASGAQTGGGSSGGFTSSSGGFSSAGQGGGTVVFEIAGQKLIGVLSNTLDANRRLGGQTNLIL